LWSGKKLEHFFQPVVKVSMKTIFPFFLFFMLGCSSQNGQNNTFEPTNKKEIIMSEDIQLSHLDTATFGAGCFWCVEAAFLSVKGVITVQSGYSGGHVKNPTYKEVCSGLTGHAEVAQIVYDTTQITYDDLLQMFWKVHDPTQLNRQGNDIGTQYRSVIYFHNDQQKEKATYYKNALNSSGAYASEVVTEIAEFDIFYPAEDYHTNYYALHPEEQYCKFVVGPKVEKFKQVFAEKLK
jgi:peptide-methionine (S)-S-oxide reductase